jgi:hypothetical protein
MQSTMFPGQISGQASGVQHRLRGGLSHIEGPLGGSGSGIFSSMQSSDGSINATGQNSISLRGNYDEGTIELMSHDMSYSAIYLHDMQFRKSRGTNQYESVFKEMFGKIVKNYRFFVFCVKNISWFMKKNRPPPPSKVKWSIP